ncbi:MAG TPA: ribosome maturation factor RimP [Bryobacteraceae bacterium]|nr:ribosome maturation factor RimP [Bryobacteraceae bacterium]
MAAVEQSGFVERITELGERAAMGTDIEIVEIQLRGAGKARLLRIYIDKPGGVTHEDCALISERLGKLLDEENVIPEDGYTLEVSSPGVERKLSKPRDFERVVGQTVRLAVQEPGQPRTSVTGKLAEVADGTLALEIKPGSVLRVPLEQVQKANLKFEW